MQSTSARSHRLRAIHQASQTYCSEPESPHRTHKYIYISSSPSLCPGLRHQSRNRCDLEPVPRFGVEAYEKLLHVKLLYVKLRIHTTMYVTARSRSLHMSPCCHFYFLLFLGLWLRCSRPEGISCSRIPLSSFGCP